MSDRMTFSLRLHLDPLLGCRGRPRHWTQTAPELSGSVVTQISQPTAHSPIWQLLPPFPEGCVYGLDLRPQPIPGGWVTPALLTRARTSCIWRVRGDLRGRLGDHIMMDIDNQSAEQEDYGPDAAAGGEPPSPLIRPRPAFYRRHNDCKPAHMHANVVASLQSVTLAQARKFARRARSYRRALADPQNDCF
eukprot:COSAG01_NODE_448_length_16920_cov_3570.438143_1_plen_191_part_00